MPDRGLALPGIYSGLCGQLGEWHDPEAPLHDARAWGGVGGGEGSLATTMLIGIERLDSPRPGPLPAHVHRGEGEPEV